MWPSWSRWPPDRQLCGAGGRGLCGLVAHRQKLNSIQSGYARPALAAGKTRFVLYNRSGNELRVESRTQNLYTKQLENSIFLCAMSDNGTLAVVTEDQTSMAKLLVYSPPWSSSSAGA